MTDDEASCSPALKRLWTGLGLLSLVIACAYPLVAWAATQWHGPGAFLSAAVAALVCWLGASLALAAAYLTAGGKNATAGLLSGMFFRTGIPLVFCTVLHFRGDALASGSTVYSVLAFYLLALGVETWSVVCGLDHKSTVSGSI